MKASVQSIVAPAATVVGNPTTIPSAPAPNLITASSYSGATIPSMPRKRNAIGPDISTTSSERSSSLSFIKNVDMGKLIEDLIKTKVPPPAYRRIQEFLNKVCTPFYYFIHSFHGIKYFLFSLHFCFSGWSGPYSSKYQA